jgi:hypothetical protein
MPEMGLTDSLFTVIAILIVQIVVDLEVFGLVDLEVFGSESGHSASTEQQSSTRIVKRIKFGI